jgi:hypothetical protein
MESALNDYLIHFGILLLIIGLLAFFHQRNNQGKDNP